MKSFASALPFILLLIGCAAKYEPGERTTQLQQTMTMDRADEILNRFAAIGRSDSGPCLIGFNPGAVLNYSAPVTTKNARIQFSARMGKGQILGKTLLPDIEIEALKPQFEEWLVSVNASGLKEIRILSSGVEQLRVWCPYVRNGYLVVLKPQHGLPADAEFSINVTNDRNLDTLLAALIYLSPNARLVRGTGM